MKKILAAIVFLPLIIACSTSQSTPTVQAPENWKTFTHNLYHYQFNYPQEDRVDGNKLGGEAVDSESVIVGTSTTAAVQIKRYGTEVYEGEDPETTRVFALGLSDFSQYVWQINKDSEQKYFGRKSVSDLSKTTLSGQEAYQFTSTTAFENPPKDIGGGWALDKETTFIVVRSQGSNFIVSYTNGDETALKIVNSLKFTTSQ